MNYTKNLQGIGTNQYTLAGRFELLALYFNMCLNLVIRLRTMETLLSWESVDTNVLGGIVWQNDWLSVSKETKPPMFCHFFYSLTRILLTIR